MKKNILFLTMAAIACCTTNVNAQVATRLDVAAEVGSTVDHPPFYTGIAGVTAEVKPTSVLGLPDFYNGINLTLTPNGDIGWGHAYQLNFNYHSLYWRRSEVDYTWLGWHRVIMEPPNGNVGIGTPYPMCNLDISDTTSNKTKAILSRLSEGGDHTHLSIKSYSSQPIGAKMFAIEHTFYGAINNSINFYRGPSAIGGAIGFNVNNNTEAARLDYNGLEVQGGIGATATHEAGGYLTLTNNSKTQTGLANKWRIYNMTGVYGNSLQFWVYDQGTMALNRFTITDEGNVGIGTTQPYYKLDVQGTLRAHEVKINLNAGADFVFENDYNLMNISDLSKFISTNKHLPDIPSAAEMTSGDTDLGEMQVKLLQKIEELTLYVIQQQETIERLNEKIEKLEKKNE
jgi:hypothetical protein